MSTSFANSSNNHHSVFSQKSHFQTTRPRPYPGHVSANANEKRNENANTRTNGARLPVSSRHVTTKNQLMRNAEQQKQLVRDVRSQFAAQGREKARAFRLKQQQKQQQQQKKTQVAQNKTKNTNISKRTQQQTNNQRAKPIAPIAPIARAKVLPRRRPAPAVIKTPRFSHLRVSLPSFAIAAAAPTAAVAVDNAVDDHTICRRLNFDDAHLVCRRLIFDDEFDKKEDEDTRFVQQTRTRTRTHKRTRALDARVQTIQRNTSHRQRQFQSFEKPHTTSKTSRRQILLDALHQLDHVAERTKQTIEQIYQEAQTQAQVDAEFAADALHYAEQHFHKRQRITRCGRVRHSELEYERPRPPKMMKTQTQTMPTHQQIILDACLQIERVHTRASHSIQQAFEEAEAQVDAQAEACAAAQAEIDERFLLVQLRKDVEQQTAIWKIATDRVNSGYFGE